MDRDDDAALVEVMARAIADQQGYKRYGVGAYAERAWRDYVDHARAALAAYRAHQEAF